MKPVLLILALFIILLVTSCTPSRVSVSAGSRPYYGARPYYSPRPYYNPYYYRNSRPWGRPHYRGFYRRR